MNQLSLGKFTSKNIIIIAGIVLVVVLLVAIIAIQIVSRGANDESEDGSSTNQIGSNNLSDTSIPGEEEEEDIIPTPGIEDSFFDQSGTETDNRPIVTQVPGRITPNVEVPAPSEDAVAVVGDETLYQSDLDNLLALYPIGVRATYRQTAIDQLIEESILLQEGNRGEVIDLNESIYNNRTKDFSQRRREVQRVKDYLESQEQKLTGSVISIWFFNNNDEPTIGYEQGRQVALEKITPLHDAVSSGDMTPEEAAEIIKDDESLEQLDFVWRQNAIIPFENMPYAEEITLDAEFNEIIRGLEVNQTSDIFLASVGEGDQRREALYMFATLDARTNPNGIESYEQWLSNKTSEYEISVY